MILDVLDHGGLFVVGQGVMGKRDQHEDAIYHDDHRHHRCAHSGHQHHEDQTYKQDGSTDLAAE